MSYSVIMQLWPGTDRIERGIELSNSHGTAPHVWSALCDYYMRESWLTGNKVIKRLWEEKLRDIRNRPNVTPHKVAYVLTSYDAVYVKAENYTKLASDLEKFFKDFPVDPEYVNHWPAIIAFLRTKPECPALGFYWTSVGDNYWELPPQECYECGNPTPKAFDWSNTFELYEDLAEYL